MLENSELLYDLLVKQQGFYYLCGPSGPIKETRNALQKSFMKHGNMKEQEADE